MPRFEKGNEIGKETRFSGENAAEMWERSQESRKKNQEMKNALLALLRMEHKSKSGEVKTGFEAQAIGLYNKALKGDVKALKLMMELIDQYKTKLEIGNNGQPFEIKTIKVSEGMQDKINDYLNGSGLDGQGVQ